MTVYDLGAAATASPSRQHPHKPQDLPGAYTTLFIDPLGAAILKS